MATKIILKHSSGTTTPTLDYGELAIKYLNGSEALYTKNSNNEIVAFNTWAKILGKPTTLSGYGIIDALGINSNAASATKLANTRTIWGQSFDGSENVSGAMTTVTSITMNGALSGATTINNSGLATLGSLSTTSGVFSTTLNVSGVTTLASSLTVSSDTTVNGGIIINGSVNPIAINMGGFRTVGTNLVLKGNSTGVSGIFFQSEKDGAAINHPSDYGFIQFHAYGIDGSSGESNRLVIGVANDTTDKVVLQTAYNNSVVVSYQDSTSGTLMPEYVVYHAGNSNLKTVDWTAKSLTVYATGGTLSSKIYVDDDGNMVVEGNLYATGEVSAYGLGPGGGGGGSVNILGSSGLGGVYLDSDVTSTFNSYTIQNINNRLLDVEASGATTILVTGSGNAVTSVTKSGTTLTFTKGSTFLTGISSLVQDNLTYSTAGTTNALSAYQGYLLNRNDITAISASTTTLTLTRAVGNLTFSVPTWNQSTTGSAGSVVNSLTLTITGGTTEGTNKYTFNGATAKTLNFVAGSNVSMVADSGSITISATNTIYSHPTQTAISVGGAMNFLTSLGVNTLGHVTGATTSAMTKANIEGLLTGAVTSHTHSYLPLSGGIMTGGIAMTENILSLSSLSDNQTDGAPWYGLKKILADSYVKLSGYYGLKLKTSSNQLEIPLGGDLTYNANKIWHAGNFNPSSYLPLSGGTISGLVTMITGGIECGFRFRTSGNSGDFIGRYSTYISLYNALNPSVEFKIPDSGYPTIGGNTVWHAGNDGAGSGLDADTLDGYHKPAFSQEFNYGTTAGNSGYYKIKILTTSQWMLCFTIRLYQGYKYYDIVISGYQYGVNYWYSPNAKLLSSSENTLAVNFGYDSVDNLWVAIPAGSYTGLKICNVTNGYNQVEQNWSSLFSVQNVSSLTGTIQTTVTAKRPLVYDENAVSATKLANTKYIWGQPFNGEGNVDGLFVINKSSIDYSEGQQSFVVLSSPNDTKLQMGAVPGIGSYIQSMRQGVDWTSRPLLLQINGGGVGIGMTPNSAYTLDVNGNGRFSEEFVVPKGGRFGSPNSDNPNKYGLSFRSDWSATNPQAGMYFGSTSASGKHGSVTGNAAMYFTMDDTTNRGWIFRQNFTGVEQNVASISNTGNITASGEITAYSASDIRLKSDIQQLTNSLDIINKLNPVSYRWNDTAKSLNPNKNDGEDYGLIAQELEDVLPNLVHNVYDKYKSIDYVKLVPFLVAGMQEQQLEIENLKSEISGLKSEVLLLNKKIKLLQYGLE